MPRDQGNTRRFTEESQDQGPFRNTSAAEMMTMGRKIGSPIVHAIICACSSLSEKHENPGQAMAGKEGTFYTRKGIQHALC